VEGKKYFLIVLFVTLLYTDVTALYKDDIYKAYITNDMSKWKTVIDEMELKKCKSSDCILELVNYQYGYVAWCIGNKKHDLAEEYIVKGEKNIEILEKSKYQLSVLYAYESAFMGFHIGLHKASAPFKGPKSIKYAKLSIKLDDKNPYGYIQYANSQYYMPAVFGGSKVIALEYFLKAQKLMEHDKSELKNNWNYLSLLTMIARIYYELGYYNAAKTCFEKIMQIEPNYNWVKNELYPELIKKNKK
jgi:tetratricopeptide (TPR) repeat protein